MTIEFFFKKRSLLLLLLVSILTGCNKVNEFATTTNVQANNGVFVAGTQNINTGFSSSISKAIVWKDGIASYIGDTTKSSVAESIFVTNDAVYVAGWEGGRATLWKNGVSTYLSNVINGSQAVKVFVENNKVYVLINEHNSATNCNNIKLWVDGVVTTIGNASINSNGNSLFVKNNDVYIAGISHDPLINNSYAMLWKNNTPFFLSNNTTHIAEALSVFVAGNDVYVSGYKYLNQFNTAVIWRNGIETNVTNSTAHGFLNSIFVDGSEVYAVGTEDNQYGVNIAAIWKNGTKTNLVGNNEVSAANDVFKYGNDVYVAGNNIKPTVWKNGVQQFLSYTNFGITINVEVKAIFVK